MSVPNGLEKIFSAREELRLVRKIEKILPDISEMDKNS